MTSLPPPLTGGSRDLVTAGGGGGGSTASDVMFDDVDLLGDMVPATCGLLALAYTAKHKTLNTRNCGFEMGHKNI